MGQSHKVKGQQGQHRLESPPPQKKIITSYFLQDILKSISIAVDVTGNGNAWARLGGLVKRRKAVSLLIKALEDAGLLLPEVIAENKEVTMTSQNIREFISRTAYPMERPVAQYLI